MVLARFLPRDEKFFALLHDSAKNGSDAAHALSQLLHDYTDVDRRVQALRDLEHRGDDITHQIFNALNRTFVTPLDREDIRDLAFQLDDFVDYIEEAARRFRLYRIDEPTDLARSLAVIIAGQADVLVELIPMLEHTKQSATKIRQLVVDVNQLENDADDALSEGLASLYDGVTDIPGMIKAIRWGEMYQLLEEASDRAESVANTIEGILLKYA